MPYIKLDRRGEFPESAGELNYVITGYCLRYLDERARQMGEPCGYQELNEVIGVLEAAKLEFYRRLVSPYEDRKIQENGDVY